MSYCCTSPLGFVKWRLTLNDFCDWLIDWLIDTFSLIHITSNFQTTAFGFRSHLFIDDARQTQVVWQTSKTKRYISLCVVWKSHLTLDKWCLHVIIARHVWPLCVQLDRVVDTADHRLAGFTVLTNLFCQLTSAGTWHNLMIIHDYTRAHAQSQKQLRTTQNREKAQQIVTSCSTLRVMVTWHADQVNVVSRSVGQHLRCLWTGANWQRQRGRVTWPWQRELWVAWSEYWRIDVTAARQIS